MITILLRQIAIMALLIAVGVVLRRKGYLSEQGTKDLGAILLRIIIPCVIIKSYIVPRTPERIQALALSAGLALLGFLVAMVLAYVVFGKRRRMENFAAAFCNAGFIGIPLAQAAIGEEGVFYVAASVALLNLFQWTYGVYIMADRRDAISARNVAKNPVVIGIIIGVVLFFTAVPVPGDRHLHPWLHRRHEYAGGHDPHGHLPGPALLAGAAGPAGLGVRGHAPGGDPRRDLAAVLAAAHQQHGRGHGGVSGRGHAGGRQHLRVRPAVRL